MTRPINGDVAITGQALRASFAGIDQYPPRISVEGANLVFTTARRRRAVPAAARRHLQLHVRPGPDDQGAIFFEAKGAKAQFTGLLGRIAQTARRPDLGFQGQQDQRPARRAGPTRSRLVRRRRNLTVQQGKLNAGEAMITAKSGALTVDDNGRLQGALDVTVREGAARRRAAPKIRRRDRRPCRHVAQSPGPVRHGALPRVF
jgi:hypothetical protein